MRHAEKFRSRRGVALILVIFIVALATLLVTNLVYSTHLAGRENNMVQRSFQAEYLLKSAINVALTLIKQNPAGYDSAKNPWGFFKDGAEIPPELLNLPERNIKVELEIRSEQSKIPIGGLGKPMSGNLTGTAAKWRDALQLLFANLGCDTDNAKDVTPLFAGRVFDSHEMVANLIDYMTPDSVGAYSEDGYKGSKSSATTGYYLNGEKISRLSQLDGVPGFPPTRARVQLFLTVNTNQARVNINVAPNQVLSALGMADDDIQKVVTYVAGDDGPLKSASGLTDIGVSSNFVTDAGTMIGFDSYSYQVIAKVSYETSSFFARAYIAKRTGSDPIISSFELF